MSGKLVILSGPSGVGKDAVIDAWIAANLRVTRVVTYTTRAPRDGETDGVDYNFVTPGKFAELAGLGRFWESKKVHGHMYASPKADTEQLLEQGRVAILKIDVQGALEVMRLCPEAVTVFIMPPSEAELERRIRERASEDEATINHRLETAKKEIECAGLYQHRVVNDDLAKTVRELQEILAE
ncbi:MAG: guanylate kinase [Armatimonadetes bacterium]|nr:guanylate kinase [Armatimonadota bacterium]